MTTRWKTPSLPWAGTLDDFFSVKDDIEVLRTSITFILLTSYGERVMLPTFGSTLSRVLFEPNNTYTVDSLKASIVEAIRAWDDRIEVIEVSATSFNEQLDVAVTFRSTKDPTATTQTVMLPVKLSSITHND